MSHSAASDHSKRLSSVKLVQKFLAVDKKVNCLLLVSDPHKTLVCWPMQNWGTLGPLGNPKAVLFQLSALAT